MLSLVGHRQGRKVIRWGCVLVAAICSATLAGAIASGLYYLLAKMWDPLVPIVGAGAGLVATVFTLLAALRTPLHRLPLLKWY